MNDLNPTCLARLMVILDLVESLAEAEGSQRALLLATLLYVYIVVAMPAKFFNQFQATVSKIIKSMTDDPAIHQKSGQAEIMKQLKSW